CICATVGGGLGTSPSFFFHLLGKHSSVFTCSFSRVWMCDALGLWRGTSHCIAGPSSIQYPISHWRWRGGWVKCGGGD
ncbi:hypothetical protein KC19_5G031700, partial [Ceratodon purpureus]